MIINVVIFTGNHVQWLFVIKNFKNQIKNAFKIPIMRLEGRATMTLDQVNKGQIFQIVSIPDKHVSAQAIRLGIYEGARLTCVYKFPAGPVIIQNGMQEIAIGRGLAKKIQVQLLDKGDVKQCSAII